MTGRPTGSGQPGEAGLPGAPTIRDLSERPGDLDLIADRVWRAFWRDRGHPLSRVLEPMRAHLAGRGVPFSLVARDAGAYLGSVLVIASDVASRPQYTPWVAGLWVEPQHRRRGIGAALVAEAARRAFALGFPRLFLCALPHRRAFYETRGWGLLEKAVDEDGMAILARDAGASDGSAADRLA